MTRFGRIEGEARNVADGNVRGENLLHEFGRVDFLREGHPDEHAARGLRPREFGVLGHEFLKRVEHGLGLFGVEGAGARHVVFHQAALQDFGRDELREGGGVKVDGLLHFDERVDHVLRSDDVAQTEARGEHLGPRAHADRAFGRNGAKRDRGTFAEIDFAVGIVFKEPEVVFAGLFAELAAAFLADRTARRILEGRHHVRKACAAAFFAEPVGIEPLVVGLHFDVFGEAEVESAERAHVGRAFDEHLAAFVEEEAGDHVRAGDVLATVKVIPEMATLNSAESRVNVAKISLEQTRRDYDRVKELFDSGVISKEEFEQSETSLSRAEEEMQNAKDNLEIVQNGIASRNAEMSNTQIRSTITGMILDVPVKVGNSVIQSNTFNDGTTIATVADLNDMIFRGKVDETEVGRLKEQMPVKLTIGALQDISLDATLEYIAPKGTEENGVVMFEIKAATKVPADIFIRAGYSANADIVIERREGVLTIPESSVTFEGNKTYVNLLTSDSTAVEQTFERKEVELGMSDGVNIEIKEGLSGNESLKGEKITAPR